MGSLFSIHTKSSSTRTLDKEGSSYASIRVVIVYCVSHRFVRGRRQVVTALNPVPVILRIRINHRAIAGTTLADQQGSVSKATDRKLPLLSLDNKNT